MYTYTLFFGKEKINHLRIMRQKHKVFRGVDKSKMKNFTYNNMFL